MFLLQSLFFTGLFIVWYSYIGYGMLIWILVRIKKMLKQKPPLPDQFDYPHLTLVVAAFNEKEVIREKIENSIYLDYPPEKLDILFITDGSTDGTNEIASQHSKIRVLHQPDRKGKVAAIHRAMTHISTPIVVFSDANTLMNKDSLKKIARHYSDPNTGGVAGEKKIMTSNMEKAAGAGEGIYWKYESFLKKLDSEFYTVVGAAGELFSIRTQLYEYVSDHILLDDFIISLKVCQKGYRVAYEPGAYAMEPPSGSIEDEKKRKVRISAGGFQSIVILKDLLNIFRYPTLSFQYISHRVLRWAVCPFLLPILLITNIIIVIYQPTPATITLLTLQIIFYAAAITGWLLAEIKIKIKLLYIPYYFLFQNYTLYLGLVRFIKGNQSVLWEKATRKAQSLSK